MLAAIRSALSTRPDPAEYQPVIPSAAANADPADPATLDHIDRQLGHGAAGEVVEYESVKVYFCFWVLGAGVLMSWNALICTFPLLISYLPPDQSLRGNLSSILSTVYCFGNLFFLGVAQRHVGKVSPAKRLHSSLLTLLVTALLTTYPALPALFPRLSSPLLLTALVFISLVLSFSTAYLQSSVFALSSLWGSEQTLGVMSGQGGIAVLVSGIQFVLAFVSVIAKSDNGQGDEGEEASKLAGVGLWAACSLGVVGCFMASRYLKRHPKYLDVLAPKFATNELNSVEGNKRESVTTRKLLKKNWELNLAVAWVFVVTLSVFPPITTRILSTHQPTPRLLQPDVFMPLHFVIFNIGDYIGRTYLPSYSALLFTSPRRILLLSLGRSLFIPIFFACNVTPREVGNAPFIDSDILYFLIILLFSMTNGYLGSLCMIVSSSPNLNPRIKEDERDVAATLASFCLVAGLAGGSLASFAVASAVNRRL
ncbi:solute carrier family 29 (equilibrative nucleoside transporter), member 1/2/3 [Cryptococcus neoformans]|nr:solute carrier family 29 (equilibrative nucleoside transporter), member 1/2/3 [Cryptococcus neoformans var. grubii Bt1]OWZ69413.1 hypothetical protein AYX14_05189 [Cryptococcus neoformans var. grubii]OWZ80111.1 solute carrier family 29 (equilibrative nucleoside transporter), member 1/2/3 [Cryptococcus neoformans var. grubii Bt85]OXG22096.1 solute carrier family 29 (equilibrative nucleoside transporter), member 1/2/3 [Cryptococcus neoformans var. grubii Tu401-1]OXG32239.1 solute carrier famil